MGSGAASRQILHAELDILKCLPERISHDEESYIQVVCIFQNLVTL